MCDPIDMCNSMIDQDAPPGTGSHDLRWKVCECQSFIPTAVNPCVVYYNKIGDVQITFIAPQQYWDPVNCFWAATAPPGIPNDCRSYVEVVYRYFDSFNFPFYDDVGGCIDLGSTFVASRQWTCYYSRRPAAGQFMAIGDYRLVRCDYPAAINTIGSTGGAVPGCSLNGGTVCSPDGLTSLGKVPTQWQPPATILVNREC